MKVAIIGASGFIGSYLLKEFSMHGFEAIGTYFSMPLENLTRLDITDKNQVRRFFEKEKPCIVLHPAAAPNVDYCETNPAETRKVNVEGSENIIALAAKHKSKLIFFSSEYVFDGLAGPYSEEDMPNPINEYGKQKLEVERAIQQTLDDILIIRTTVAYGWEARGKNFVMGLIEKNRSKIKVNVPADQISNPTYAQNLAAAVCELVEKNKQGIYNIVGSDRLNRFEFARLVCEVFGLNPVLVVPAITEALQQKAQRPLNAGLSITKAKKELRTKLVSAREGLELMKKEKNGNSS